MDNIFLVAGIAALLGAVVGGGLKAFGVELPLLESVRRQVALGIIGAVLIGVGIWQSKQDADGTGGPAHSPPDKPATTPAETDETPFTRAGTWTGHFKRRTETTEDWTVTVTRRQSGKLRIEEELVVYYDGDPPFKKGSFRVQEVTADEAVLQAAYAVLATKDLNPAFAIPNEHPSILMRRDANGWALILYQREGRITPYVDAWTKME